jgi:hypothetical protein
MRNKNEFPPLAPGDVAIRFRTVPARDGKLRVAGVQAVSVLAVEGVYVRWTNGSKKSGGGRYESRSLRCELLSLSAFDFSTSASTPLEKMAGKAEVVTAGAE